MAVVDSSLESIQVSLVNSSFKEIATGTGGLRADDLLPGIYEMRLSAGTAVDSRLICLGPGEKHSELAELAFPTATPLPGSSTWDPRHELIAVQASQHIVDSARGDDTVGGLLVMARLEKSKNVLFDSQQLDVRAITNVGAPSSPAGEAASRGAWLHDSGPDWAVQAGAVVAGGYSLRSQQESVAVEQPVWVAPGWQTIIFLPGGDEGIEVGRATIAMAPIDRPWTAEVALPLAQASELAIAGLREHRSILPEGAR